jgi:hypothetical protein
MRTRLFKVYDARQAKPVDIADAVQYMTEEWLEDYNCIHTTLDFVEAIKKLLTTGGFEAAGMAWWNGLSKLNRGYWLQRAGLNSSAADAYFCYLKTLIDDQAETILRLRQAVATCERSGA